MKLDNRPTMAEWPVKVWAEEEIPSPFYRPAKNWYQDCFAQVHLIYAPKRKTALYSHAYLLGYSETELFYSSCEIQSPNSFIIKKSQITTVQTKRELLNAEIILTVENHPTVSQLSLSYVASVYYLYNPFLNWVFDRSEDFSPAVAAQAHPRPEKLYHESLTMYNYSLAAYYLDDSFSEYEYRNKITKHKWQPWKKEMEEWITIPMKKGTLDLHHLGYLTECVYSR